MALFNNCENFSKSEYIYYSFFKNLIFAFNELQTIERIYSTSFSRVLYFLNLNDIKNDCPTFQIQKVLTDYFENVKKQHIQFSSDCNNIYNALIDLYKSNQQNRINNYVKKKEKLIEEYSQLKVDYDKKKTQYEKQAIEVVKTYKNMIINKSDEAEKDYKTTKDEALKLQDDWLICIYSTLNERKTTVQKRRKIIRDYKQTNIENLKTINSKIIDYLNKSSKLHTTYINDITSKIEKLKKSQYDNMFDDISEWSDPPKYEFAPITAGQDQLFKDVSKTIDGTDNTDFAKKLKKGVEDAGFKYIHPEFYGEEKEKYDKIDKISQKSIEGKEQISDEEVKTVCEKNEYILFFLRILNKKRSSLIEINGISFEFFHRIMDTTLNKIMNDNTKQEEPEEYFELIEYVMILSQTFYGPFQEEKRKLLQDIICTHKFWQTADVWIDTIKYHIAMEKEKQRLDEEKNYDIREEKEKSIATSAFTTYYFNMKSFDIDSDIRDEVKIAIQNYYKIPTDIIQALDSN